MVVTASSGRAGHDATTVSVDTPPSTVSLSSSSVGVADGYLTLSFTAPSDEDLASVTVYVSTVAFDSADWSEGGPDYEGPDDLSNQGLQVPSRVSGSQQRTRFRG